MAIDDTDDGINTFFSYRVKTTFTRMLDDIILPTTITINMNFTVLEHQRIFEGVEKINYWFDNYIKNSIVFSAGNEVATKMLFSDGSPSLANLYVAFPYEPIETVLMYVFQAKCDALADGAFFVASMEMETSAEDNLKIAFVGDPLGELPSLKAFVPVDQYWFESPWWERDDISTFDVIPSGNEDFTKTPEWAKKIKFDNHTEPVVLHGDFKPTLV